MCGLHAIEELFVWKLCLPKCISIIFGSKHVCCVWITDLCGEVDITHTPIITLTIRPPHLEEHRIITKAPLIFTCIRILLNPAIWRWFRWKSLTVGCTKDLIRKLRHVSRVVTGVKYLSHNVF